MHGGAQTGKTPLMVAARAGKEAIVAALLDAGAKTGMKDASGKTALDYARQKKRNYIVEVLQVRRAASSFLSTRTPRVTPSPHHCRECRAW